MIRGIKCYNDIDKSGLPVRSVTIVLLAPHLELAKCLDNDSDNTQTNCEATIRNVMSIPKHNKILSNFFRDVLFIVQAQSWNV